MARWFGVMIGTSMLLCADRIVATTLVCCGGGGSVVSPAYTLLLVQAALGANDIAAGSCVDLNGDQRITVNELVAMVAEQATGCPTPTPTLTPTPTPPTATPSPTRTLSGTYCPWGFDSKLLNRITDMCGFVGADTCSGQAASWVSDGTIMVIPVGHDRFLFAVPSNSQLADIRAYYVNGGDAVHATRGTVQLALGPVTTLTITMQEGPLFFTPADPCPVFHFVGEFAGLVDLSGLGLTPEFMHSIAVTIGAAPQ